MELSRISEDFMETQEKRPEQADLANPAHGLNRSTRGPLHRLTLVAFIGYAVTYFVVFFYALLVAKTFIPPIVIEATLILLAAGVVATCYFSKLGNASLPQTFPELTEREREILTLIAQGRNNAEIAARLVLSPKTVRNHVSNIFNKLQVADRAQAIIRAREAGLK